MWTTWNNFFTIFHVFSSVLTFIVFIYSVILSLCFVYHSSVQVLSLACLFPGNPKKFKTFLNDDLVWDIFFFKLSFKPTDLCSRIFIKIIKYSFLSIVLASGIHKIRSFVPRFISDFFYSCTYELLFSFSFICFHFALDRELFLVYYFNYSLISLTIFIFRTKNIIKQ